MKLLPRELVLGLLLAVAPAARLHGAINPAEWPRQLPFAVSRPGLTRVELPLESLALTRADRGDLRVLDPDGQEVPWRLHRAVAAEPPRAILNAGRLAARFEDRRSYLEFDTETDRSLSGLRLVTTASGFFKAAILEGLRGGTWETLASGVPLYQDYLGATDVRLDFSPGTWTRMRLVLDDRRSAPIPVQSIVLLASTAARVPVATVAAVIRTRTEEPGLTRFQVDLGAAGLDVAWIELETPEPLFTRPVRIQAERIAGDALVTEELVRAFVHRIPGDAKSAEDNRRVRVERSIPTREIVLTIENGDSPPLASPSLRAGLHAQRIEFWATKAGPHRLLAGNAFAAIPRYDISRLALPAEIAPETVLAGGPWSPNPAYKEPAVGPDALGLGAAFAPRGWRHHRTLTAGVGTAELELPADVVAAARPDLADLRIVRAGRQVPYVADPNLLRRKLPLTIVAEPIRPKSQSSTWRLETADRATPVAIVRIDTSQQAFARPVRWYEILENREGTRWTNVLASAEWKRVPGGASRPLELVPGSRPVGATTWIELDDGDNPPLPSLTATAEYTTRRLFFLAGGVEPMELHYGNPDAMPPRYDLALLADRLNASSRLAAALGPAEERRPGWGETVVSGTGLQIVFWVVLAGVVGVLFAVIRRMLPAPPVGR